MAKKKSRSRGTKASRKSAKSSTSKKSALRLTRSRIIYLLVAVVLWALIWGLLSFRERGISAVRENRVRSYQTQLFLREIERALATYRKERGTVPQCPDEKNGAAVLFQTLLAGEPRYLGPRPDRIRHGKTEDEPSVIIDSWGDPIRYRTGSQSGGAVSANPDYDLWSTGGDPGNSREKWITP